MKMNRVTALLLIICMLSVAFLAVSCDTSSENSASGNEASENSVEASLAVDDESSIAEDNGKVSYTVTVVDQNNAPLEGITIQFCDDANCKMPVVTDADGKVTVEYDESNYHITITEASGYSYETQYDFEKGSAELTITLTAE